MTLPPTGLIYLDTNIVIYRVERSEPYWEATAPLWEALDDGHCEVATSELTWLEVLVKPLQDGNIVLANLYREVLLASNLECLAIDIAILEMAAKFRADYRIKTPTRSTLQQRSILGRLFSSRMTQTFARSLT